MDNPKQPVKQTPPVAPSEPTASSYYGGKRNWVKLGIIYLVVAALLYGGIYYFVFSKNKSNPYSSNYNYNQTSTATYKPTPIPDETENWKTYISKSSGYSIKYPPTLSFEENAAGYVTFDRQITIYTSQVNPENCRGDCPVIESAKNVTIGSFNSREIKGYIGRVGGDIPQRYVKYVLEKNGIFFVFTVNELKNDANTPDDRKLGEVPFGKVTLLEQMISTFKFTQ